MDMAEKLWKYMNVHNPPRRVGTLGDAGVPFDPAAKHTGERAEAGHTSRVSDWELVVLGTASQAPTRHRNHNGYFLRAGEAGVLFDPGEGTQRQMTLTDVSASRITRICVTHLHGDHCLGLPGVIQRLSLDRVTRLIPLYHPASGAPYVERLRHASIFDDVTDIVPMPLHGPGLLPAPFDPPDGVTLRTRPLRHRVDSFGFRVEEPPHVNFDVEALREAGVHGHDVGRLRRDGSITLDGRTIELRDVSVTRPGRVVAFVMDTAWCDDAIELARGADLLVCESTFLTEHAEIAERYGHLTARQAAEIAVLSGARRLLLTHFSQREPKTARYVAEAAQIFPHVIGAEDGMRVPVPIEPRSVSIATRR
jgi:ribonuclease Z